MLANNVAHSPVQKYLSYLVKVYVKKKKRKSVFFLICYESVFKPNYVFFNQVKEC